LNVVNRKILAIAKGERFRYIDTRSTVLVIITVLIIITVLVIIAKTVLGWLTQAH